MSESDTPVAGHLPRMDDVARLAGVNKATVSRALKGDHRISPATREKVWKSAKVLGYHPDAVARGLSSKRMDMAAIVVRRLDSPWIGGVLCGVLRVLERQGMDVLLKEAAEERQAVRVLREISSRRADGVLWFGAAPDAPDETRFGEGSVPMVVVGDVAAGSTCVVPALEETVAMLKTHFGGAVTYACGRTPHIPGLAGLLPAADPDAKAVIRDGDCGASGAGIPVIRTSESPAPADFVLRWPAFEVGTAAARILMNRINARGLQPSQVRIPLLLEEEK